MLAMPGLSFRVWCGADMLQASEPDMPPPCPSAQHTASSVPLSRRGPGVQSLEAGVQDLRCSGTAPATQAATAAHALAPLDPEPSRDPRAAPEPGKMPWLSFDMAATAMASLLAATPPGRVPVITAELLHEASSKSRPKADTAAAHGDGAEAPRAEAPRAEEPPAGGSAQQRGAPAEAPVAKPASGVLPWRPRGAEAAVACVVVMYVGSSCVPVAAGTAPASTVRLASPKPLPCSPGNHSSEA